jgi:integrase/recombinase XerD
MILELEDYLRELQVLNYSSDSIEQAQRTIGRLIAYLQEIYEIEQWCEVSKEHVEAFADWARLYGKPKAEQISTQTIIGRLGCVRQFFIWMVERARLLHNPAQRLKSPPRVHTQQEILSEPDIAKLIESPNIEKAIGLRDRAMMETLYATGIRLAEAQRLTIYDLDTRVERLVIGQGKGESARILPLTEQSCYWLDRYIIEARAELATAHNPSKHASAGLWLSEHGRQMSKRGIGSRIVHYAEQTALRVTAHTFRHCFATHLLRRGVSIEELKRLLGHKDIRSTEIYVRVELEDLQRIAYRTEKELD